MTLSAHLPSRYPLSISSSTYTKSQPNALLLSKALSSLLLTSSHHKGTFCINGDSRYHCRDYCRNFGRQNYGSVPVVSSTGNSSASWRNCSQLFASHSQKSHYSQYNPFMSSSIYKTLFQKGKYEELIHDYRSKFMVRYEMDEPLRPNGTAKTVDSAMYLSALAKERRIEELYEAFRYLLAPKNPSSILFNTMLRCLLELDRYDDAIKLYQKGIELNQRNQQVLNIKTLNTIMKYLIKEMRFDDALALYQKHCMHANPLSKIVLDPDMKTIRLLSRIYIEKNDLRTARQVIESECLERKLDLDVTTPFELMKAHLHQYDLEGAYWVFIDFFTTEPESEVSNPMIRLLDPAAPSAPVLATLMQAFFEEGNTELPIELFSRFCVPKRREKEEEDDSDTPPEDKALLHLYQQTSLEAPLFNPSPPILSAMIKGLAANDRLDVAELLFEEYFRKSEGAARARGAQSVVEEMLAAYSFHESDETPHFLKYHFATTNDRHLENAKDLFEKHTTQEESVNTLLKQFPITPKVMTSIMWYYYNKTRYTDAAKMFANWTQLKSFNKWDTSPKLQRILHKTVAQLDLESGDGTQEELARGLKQYLVEKYAVTIQEEPAKSLPLSSVVNSVNTGDATTGELSSESSSGSSSSSENDNGSSSSSGSSSESESESEGEDDKVNTEQP